MKLKKILFCFMLSITIIQSTYAADKIFDLLDNPQELQNYLIQNPAAIDAKNDRNQSVLYDAIYRKKDLEIIKILLDAGANPNVIISHTDPSIPHRRPKIDTLLHKLAIRYNNDSSTEAKDKTAEQAAWLVLYGADDSIQDSKGRTPQEISPELSRTMNTIIETEHKRERQAFEALFGAEFKHNTGITATTYNFLNQPNLTNE